MPLISAALEPAVREAIGIWSQSGLDAGQLSLLDRVDVRTADLNGTTLGATFGPTVWIDRDAARYGWSDSGLDLLSVVTHEFGHVLGLERENGMFLAGLRWAGVLGRFLLETGSGPPVSGLDGPLVLSVFSLLL